MIRMVSLQTYIPFRIPLRWQAPFEALKPHLGDAFPEDAFIKRKNLPSADYGLLATVIYQGFRDIHPLNDSYYVYILQCERPRNIERAEAFSEKLAEYEDGPHSWLRRALEVDEVYYVGTTKNIYRRLWEHVADNHLASHFTTVFKATHLVNLESDKGTRKDAKRREVELRRSINDIPGDQAFAYSELSQEEEEWSDEVLGRRESVGGVSISISETEEEPIDQELETELTEWDKLRWDEGYIPQEWK